MTDPRGEIFAAVRAARPGVFADPGNILALDNLLDAFGVDREQPPRSSKRRVAQPGIDLMHLFEGCARLRPDGNFEAYPDPGSKDGRPWTIGWGSTGSGIGPGTVWTRQQCDDRFANDLQAYADEVAAVIGAAPTSQNQFDALVSFHYNTGKLPSSTLFKKHCAGEFLAAKAEFAKWVYNDGKVLKGLVSRRAAEAELYGSA